MLKKHKRFLEQYIMNNDNILAAFYSGSIARNDSDIFSDIDLRFVIDENVKKDKLLQEFVNLFEDKLFIEDKSNDFAVFHLEDLLKIDTFVFYKDDLLPSVWLSNIHIIKDDQNFLSQIKERSNQTVTISTGRITYIRNKYLAHLIETYKRDKRAEYHYLNYSINMMANIICYLWYLDMGEEPNSLGDWSKYQSSRSKLNTYRLEILNDLLNKDYFYQRIVLNKELIKVLDSIDKKYKISKSNESKSLINKVTNKLHNK